ncbi:MAG: hypothetical protein U1E27_06655 [Kiritimatiellia bacterium]|nr:hypothetical protein [Kiritimatiellia bacterium]
MKISVIQLKLRFCRVGITALCVLFSGAAFAQLAGETPDSGIAIPAESLPMEIAAPNGTSEPSVAAEPMEEPEVPAAGPQDAAPVSERIERNGEIAPGMHPDHISLTLTDTELLQVVDLFIKVSGANIIASPTNLTGRVTVSLRDVDWKSALTSILDMHSLTLVEVTPDSKVYSIMPKPEGAPEPLFIENFQLNFLRAETLSDAAKLLLEPNGRVLLAQGSRLSVLGTSQRIRDVRKLVEDVDRRVPQVVVESKFVELNEQAIKDLGINWQVLEGFTTTLSQPALNFNRTSTRNDLQQDARVNTRASTSGSSSGLQNNTLTTTDIPTDAVTGARTVDRTSSRNNSSGSGSYGISGQNFSEFDDGKIAMVPPYNMVETRALSAILTASDLALTLSALKQNTGADIISNPKIIVSSGESATIHVGERRPNIVRKLQSTAGGTSEATYEFGDPPWIDIGVKVKVTPTVNTESNITLRIVPELDRQIGFVEPTPGLTFPILVTRRIESEFALESGKTVAIGGLTQTTDSEVVKKIPFLGDIPIIGKYFFSHTRTERRQDEVIIFVTLVLANSETLQYESGIPTQGRLITSRFTDPQSSQLMLRNRGQTIGLDAE